MASGAILPEDLELDREIAQMAAAARFSEEAIPYKDEPELEQAKHLDVIDSNHLKDYVEDYKPADSHMSLEQQIYLAKSEGCDTIEATDGVFKAIFGKVPPECYAMVKGIKVYRIGMVELGEKLDARTFDQILNGYKPA